MTTPRRRVIRPTPPVVEADRREVLALDRRRAKLAQQRAACHRWLAKLKRALRAVDKHLRQIGRLEKSLSSERIA